VVAGRVWLASFAAFFDYGYPSLRHADGVVFCIKLNYSVKSESLFNEVGNEQAN
jgi:hypothetical protein